MKKLLTFIFLLFITNSSYAETIWCRNFNLGCMTQKDKEKELRFCNNLANDTYRQALNTAISDPTIWQFGGFISAEDYADKRYQSMLSRCLKK
jgi:hypothetical protein